MSTLTFQQVAQDAYNAGFRGVDLITATAIAYAESQDNPSNVNTNAATEGPGLSWGLWQIDRTYHPQYSSQSLLVPANNAQAAFQVYQSAGNSFSPWSTFKSGAYLAYVSQAAAAVQQLGQPNTPESFSPITGILPTSNPIATTQQALGALTSLLQWLSNPGRSLKLVIGVGLVFVALIIIAAPDFEAAVNKATKTVQDNPEVFA